MKSFLKIAEIIFGSLWLIFFILSITLFAQLIIHKNEITRSLLLNFNNIQKGEFTLQGFTFTPLKQFPDISIKLKNLSYFENKSGERKTDEAPIATIENFYLGIDVVGLLSGKLNISKLLIDDGEITIITYPDSSINLLNAFNNPNLKSEEQKNKPLLKDSVYFKQKHAKPPLPEKESTQLTLKINQFKLNNLKLVFRNYLLDRESSLLIKNLEAGLDYADKNANISLTSSILVKEFRLNKEFFFRNENIDLNVKASFNQDKKVEIKTSRLEIGHSVFKLDGIFNPQNDGELSLNVDGSDAGFSLISSLLKTDERKNIKRGDFYFKGTVSGKTFNHFPLINLTFGLKDVELINPVTYRKIKNLNFSGRFNSGHNDDFSEAKLEIDTLYADFPDGTLKLSGKVNNFTEPDFDVQLYLNADLTGLDKVFNLNFINDLKGRIEVEDKFSGKYLVTEKRFLSKINNAQISLSDFGFMIPGALRFDKINGRILRQNNDYYFKELSVISEGTDFLINGKIEDLQYLFFNIEKEINADLTIKSSVFDLPNFLSFDPSIKRDFPYRILNIYVDVLAKISTSKAIKFKSFPEIEFVIKRLDAMAENFLPPIKIKSGKFIVSESILGFNLKSENFMTKFLDGNFNFTGEYNSSKYQPFYIKAKTDFKNVSPAILFFSEKDTIPEALSGKLTGSFFVDLQFPLDSTTLKFLNIKDADLLYHLPKDTIKIKSLTLKIADVYFNDSIDQNPLATLSTKGNIKAAELYSKGLDLDNIIIDFNVQNGTYKINSNQVRFFGKNAKGKTYWDLSPFSDLPSYHINYFVNKFYAEEMLESFKLDTMITGPLSLSMDVKSQGSDWNTIINNMNGSINLSGKNLIFYGMDADKVIEKFKRSQSFNLVDLGAVLIAGPIGIAVTKGTDFARVLLVTPGESSHIKNLVSNWEIESGKFVIDDVAFSTPKNRIAAKGYFYILKDSLDVTLALLNKKGCSVFSQRIFGNLNTPTLGKVQVVGTILAPVTNLIDDVLGLDCDVFYNGSLKQPN